MRGVVCESAPPHSTSRRCCPFRAGILAAPALLLVQMASGSAVVVLCLCEATTNHSKPTRRSNNVTRDSRAVCSTIARVAFALFPAHALFCVSVHPLLRVGSPPKSRLQLCKCALQRCNPQTLPHLPQNTTRILTHRHTAPDKIHCPHVASGSARDNRLTARTCCSGNRGQRLCEPHPVHLCQYPNARSCPYGDSAAWIHTLLNVKKYPNACSE